MATLLDGTPGADIHKTRYRTDVLDINERYRSGTGHYHVYERGVPDIVLQHEKCVRHSVKVPGKCVWHGYHSLVHIS